MGVKNKLKMDCVFIEQNNLIYVVDVCLYILDQLQIIKQSTIINHLDITEDFSIYGAKVLKI